MGDVLLGIPISSSRIRPQKSRKRAKVPRDPRRLDVSCQISEKVVAFCPVGDTVSRNTLQSCKGRWDLRDIPQRGSRLPVIQVHILEDSLSQINATFPAGDVSLSTCSATFSIRSREKKLDDESFLSRSAKII